MNYWQNRYENLKKNMEKDEDKLKKKLSFFYDKERVSLEKEIASFYQRYGENNIIEYRNLLQSLSMEEKDMLIKRADDFIEKYPKYKNILPVRENIYKLNRLEGLQYSILLKQYEIGVIEQEEIENHLRKYALNGANITYETLGFGKNFLSINSDVISKILDNSYAGEENFSDRIWNNKKKLANYLNNDFAKAVARGDSYDKCVKALKERFSKVTRNDCYRLIFTEGTYVLNESTITPFEEDFESYEISTVGDGRVCNICTGISGKVFNIKERIPGINFPPFHPWCRCSFEVVVEDWDKWLDDYESKHSKSGDTIKNRLYSDEYLKINNINVEGYNLSKEKEVKEYIESELGLLPKKHRDIIDNIINKIKIHKYNSMCDYKNRIIYLDNKPIKGELIHECAHVLDKYYDIFNDKDYIVLLEDLVKDFDDKLIINLEDYDKQVYFIKDERLVSKYQGRVYEPIFVEGGDKLNINCLKEYFTEGYKTYILNPQELKKKDIRLYYYIKEKIK